MIGIGSSDSSWTISFLPVPDQLSPLNPEGKRAYNGKLGTAPRSSVSNETFPRLDNPRSLILIDWRIVVTRVVNPRVAWKLPSSPPFHLQSGQVPADVKWGAFWIRIP